ncbi:MAG: histidinol-phosphate transaminase [Syntrophales bacterium]|nr:histidinol-phosphate transaminase [Syntrophales bacterium]MDY0043040.1 histidinol-phosphate transaminase [Syntrophales bacterium]
MSRYWSSIVHKLTPYIPGEQPKFANLIKLNTNENPYGPSPKVLEALKAEANANLRLYPEPDGDSVKEAVSRYYGVAHNQVFVGNGSDEVLAHVFLGLFKHSLPLLYPDITYSFYPVYCKLYDVEYETVPLSEFFELVLEDYRRPNGGIIFPNPNAPTGIALDPGVIEELLKFNRESVVAVDEAYVDFGAESAIRLIDTYPNLLVIQTLSKSRSLAGLRVGFAVGNRQLIEALERVKNSFNSYPLDRLAIAGAVAAMEDRSHFEKNRQMIIATREALAENLCSLGFQVLPSKANFLFVRHPFYDAEELSRALRKEGIVVRHFAQERISQFLRITVGTDAQSDALCDALCRAVIRPGSK